MTKKPHKFKNGDMVQISEEFYSAPIGGEDFRTLYFGNIYTILGEQVEIVPRADRKHYEK